MCPNISSDNYYSVGLSRGAKVKRERIHRLMLRAFVGEPQNDLEACHNNGIRSDNSLSNLRWGTRKSNVADQYTHGTRIAGERHPMSKLSNEQADAIRSSKLMARDLAVIYGVSKSLIDKIRCGECRGIH